MMRSCEKECYDESETDAEFSDDSEEDPSFDVVEETRLTFSNLSLKRKAKRIMNNNVNGKDEKEDEGELNEQDQKSYETIQKMIEGGQVDKLKVEQCKIYLRKHGLRLSGNKETLILRIKEHIDIVNGGGEKKYPASNFVLNCKGDACKGDVVMFEQNVYEEFNIASRSANGGPRGTRTVAGRILKESYGAAKQQHTFTIEVLWSKGEKPLPPLHPLLIKGRNLYRLNTMRQKWEDEGERQRILLEKHSRGGAARLNREARIQQREMRKMHKPTRATRNEHLNGKRQQENREPLHSARMAPDALINQPKQQQQQHQNDHCHSTTFKSNIPIQPVNSESKPNNIPNAHAPLLQRQPLISTNHIFQKGHYTGSQSSNFFSSQSPTGKSFHQERLVNYHTARSPIRRHPLIIFPNSNHVKLPIQRHIYKGSQGCSYVRSPSRGFGHENGHSNSQQSNVQNLNAARNSRVQQQGNEQKQKCRYFVQGRCYFGDRCKYLHESAGNK